MKILGENKSTLRKYTGLFGGSKVAGIYIKADKIRYGLYVNVSSTEYRTV